MFGKKKKNDKKAIKKETDTELLPEELEGDDYEKEFEKDEVSTPEEAQAKMLSHLSGTKNIELHSEASFEEIHLLAALKTIADETDNTVMKKYIKNFLMLRVSFKRKGRQEILQAGRGWERSEDKLKRSLKSVVLGMK